MTREEAIKQMEEFMVIDDWSLVYLPDLHDALELAVEALREMPVEAYRQRLMEVFHRTDHDELLTYVVMPKEEEFKSLEYILRQYKYEPRLRGEWEYVTHHARRFRVCSVCKAEKEDDRATGWNFCQYCGSDNRKSGETE